MDETMNASAESTISEQMEQQQEVSSDNLPATAPQEQGEPEDNTVSNGEGMNADSEPDKAEPYMIARFNHEDKPLSREEATNWVQLGMKHQALYDRLDYIAAQSDKSVDELVDNMMSSMESQKRDELADRFGDDESTINDLMTIWRNQQKEKYDKVVSDRASATAEKEQSLNERLANEFTEMKKDFPELTDYASLPQQVRKAAADGMPLAYAYLMHNHTEQKKVALAAEQAAEAAKKTAGSMNTDGSDTATEADKRFLASLWGN